MFLKIRSIAKPFIQKSPFLYEIYKYVRDNSDLVSMKETPMGFKMIGNRLMQKGVFELEETKIIKKILEDADIFVNVGANIGYYCCLALQYDKYVIAFEPIYRNLRSLFKNIKANHWGDKIEVFPIALSNKVGIIEIFGSGTGASLVKGWAGTPEQDIDLVPTSTLDNVIGSRFDDKKVLLLVDIEGAEKSFLEGALSTLSRQIKPIWIVEISVSEHQPKGIKINPNLLSTFEIFWDRGYESWTLSKELRLVSHEDIEYIAQGGENNLGTHNFIFLQIEDRSVIARLKGDI